MKLKVEKHLLILFFDNNNKLFKLIELTIEFSLCGILLLIIILFGSELVLILILLLKVLSVSIIVSNVKFIVALIWFLLR